MNYEDFPLWMVGTWTIPCLVGILGIVQLAITFWLFFPHPHRVLAHTYAPQYSANNLRRSLYRSPDFSFCAAPSTPVFCPTNPSCFGFFQHWSLVSSTPWDHWTLVPLPVLWFGDALLVSWAITGLVMFVLPLSEISLMLPVVQCLKQLYQIFFFWFSSFVFFLMWEGNCHSSYSIRRRSRNLISNW